MSGNNRAYETQVDRMLLGDFQEVESNRQDPRKFDSFRKYDDTVAQQRAYNNQALQEMRERSLAERRKDMLDESNRREKMKQRGGYRIPDDNPIALIDKNEMKMGRSDSNDDDEVYDEAQGYNKDYFGDTPQIYPNLNEPRR